MSIFSKFERKVESAVNGVFARAFKGDLQPVEISARLQKELDAEAKLLNRDKRLVPNEFKIGLSDHDHDKLMPYSKTLIAEIGTELKSHAREMGYVFNGPIRIHFEVDSSLPTGRFTVASEAVAGMAASRPAPPTSPRPASGPTSPPAGRVSSTVPAAGSPGARSVANPWSVPADPAGSDDKAASGTSAAAAGPKENPVDNPPSTTPEAPQLVLEVNGMRHPLSPPGFVIGRGTDADLRINDPGISRLHAEITVHPTTKVAEIKDLGSTNGITVNGHKVQQATLLDGTRIEIGSTRMLVHAPAGR